MTQLGLWELGALDWIRAVFSSPPLDAVMKAVSFLGEAGWIFILAGLAMVCLKKTRRAGLIVLLALALSGLIVNLGLKPLIGRLRPYALNPDVALLIQPPADPSFPSGHTSIAFAFFFAVRGRDKRLAWGAGLLAGLMAFSRLYLYVHFPRDVLAGVLCGLLCAALSRRIWEKAPPSLTNKLIKED